LCFSLGSDAVRSVTLLVVFLHIRKRLFIPRITWVILMLSRASKHPRASKVSSQSNFKAVKALQVLPRLSLAVFSNEINKLNYIHIHILLNKILSKSIFKPAAKAIQVFPTLLLLSLSDIFSNKQYYIKLL